ncbi:MAG: gas vesicle protein [Methanocalculus sp.]|nr:gas vesicle protein [Methanocalculus sp.]MDO8841919.1 gas vesicle protein [Methanocalculus sp.]
MQANRNEPTSLVDVIDRILDKGLVINADICVSVVGVELLGITIRAALASFETAAKYGLEFPSGTNLNAPAWREMNRMQDQESERRRFEDVCRTE